MFNVHDLDPYPFFSGRIQVLDPHQNKMDPNIYFLHRRLQFFLIIVHLYRIIH